MKNFYRQLTYYELNRHGSRLPDDLHFRANQNYRGKDWAVFFSKTVKGGIGLRSGVRLYVPDRHPRPVKWHMRLSSVRTGRSLYVREENA